jgi:hypothetical protein
MRLPRVVEALVLLTGSAAFALASTISIPGSGGSFTINEQPDSIQTERTLGQVFVVPTPLNEFVLKSFGFAMQPGQDGVDYRGYIYEWANDRATGPALFASAALTTPDPPSFFGLSLVLDPAKEYIAFLTTQGGLNNSVGALNLVANFTNPYGPGSAFLQQSTLPFTGLLSGDWTTAPWVEIFVADLQFEARFDAAEVPEPSTFAVAVATLAALALTRHRRIPA